MAKVIFWKSPIDPTQKLDFSTDKKTLVDILEQLDIDKEPLSVILNGEVPDEIALDLEIKPEDVLEIRKIVHGNSSSSKNTWATVISIVALVAATVLTAGFGLAWWAAGVTLIGGVASGALRYRAAKLAVRPGGQTQSEIDVETNSFSLNAAQNESRPLQPLPLPMGSVRTAPDFFAQPYPNYYGGVFEELQNYVDGYFIPSGDPLTWDTFPAMSIVSPNSTPWPIFSFKIMPEVGLTQWNGFSASKKREFAPQYVNQLTGNTVSGPVIIYHHNAGDPNFGKFSIISIHYQVAQQITGSRGYVEFLEMINYYNDSAPYPANTFSDVMAAYLRNNVNGQNERRWKLGTADYFIGPSGGILAEQNFAINEYIKNMVNAGTISPTPRPTIFRQETEVQKILETPVRAMTHVFNYGLGDLTISDRRIDKVEVDNIVALERSEIDRDSWFIPPTTNSDYLTNVITKEGASLVNSETFPGPSFLVSPLDSNIYNFTYRESPLNTRKIEIDIESQLYGSGGSGFTDNTSILDIQYRKKGDTNWTVWPNPGDLYYRNNTPLLQRRTFSVSLPESAIWELRMRKATPDSENNTGNNVAKFDCSAVKWFVFGGDAYVEDKRALILEGLFLVENSQTSGQTNKYSAQVDSKCWVYDFDTETWSWDFTRNPAWWFLFFARGGFKNLSADGSFVFPWSPTKGWVNGPGHPDNTEILFGCGMPDSKIDVAGIMDWASFCEDRELYVDLVFKDATTEIEMLEKLANIGRGSVSYYKGLLSVVYEDNMQTPVGLYGMGNIIQGSFSADYSVANIPSKVIGSFVDRDLDWESSTVEAVVPFSDPNDLNFITTTLDGITTREQAQREVNILAARQFFQKRTYTWKVDKEGIVAKRGDLVYLSHDSTQFSYSGRVLKFIVDVDNNVTGIETTAEIFDKEIGFVTIRLPNGDLKNYSCSVNKCSIMFEEEFLIADAPYYLNGDNSVLNADSLYPNSEPNDYIFIAGPLATTGKVVRISQIQPDESMNFTITAIDEDPAMWSYEYGPVIDPDSFNDSTVLARVYNVAYKQLGEGNVKLFWEVDGADFIKIVNVDTGLLMNADGQVSFSRGEVILELVPGAKYNLRIEPFVIGSPYKQENKVIVVWA